VGSVRGQEQFLCEALAQDLVPAREHAAVKPAAALQEAGSDRRALPVAEHLGSVDWGSAPDLELPELAAHMRD